MNIVFDVFQTLFGDFHNIKDFQDTHSVDDEKDDEPTLMVMFCR